MSIKAGLRGHDFDLLALSDLYPTSSNPAVIKDDDGYYLTSLSLTADPEEDVFTLVEQASRLLRLVVGAARAVNRGIQPVELAGHFKDSAGNRHTVLQVDSAVVRSYVQHVNLVVDGELVPPPPPPAPTYVQLANRDPDVQDALNFLGKPGSLDWFDLWKVFEVVRDNVDPPPPGSNRKGNQQKLVDTGWITPDELKAFGGSANHQRASGDAARHARERGDVPKRVLTLREGRALILRVVERWLDSLR